MMKLNVICATYFVFSIAYFGQIYASYNDSVVDNAVDQRTVNAEEYFTEGRLAQNDGQMNDALPFYRAAVRLLPDSVDYLLALGLAEFQLGFYEKAQMRFIKVLKLDPHSTTAKYYLKVLATKVKTRNIDVCFEDDCEGDEDSYSLLPILELSILELSPCGPHCNTFPTFTNRSSHPFVLRNALVHLGGELSVFSLDALNTSYGAQRVDFYPQNMITKPTKVYNVPFSSALQYLSYPEGAYMSVDTSNAGTYIQWNMNQTTWEELLLRSELINMPRVLTHSMDSLFSGPGYSLEQDTLAGLGSASGLDGVDPFNSVKQQFGQKTHWYMLLVGEEGSGMFAHQDTLAVGSWQAQVAGSKSWRICSPTGPVAADAPPRMSGAKGQVCYETILHMGDLIYYPPYYWHETRNLESPSISLSGTVVVDAKVEQSVGEHLPSTSDSTYREALKSALLKECRENKKGFNFNGDDICSILS